MAVAAWWMFQEFGVPRAVPVHLAGTDRQDYLVGRNIVGTLPDGKCLNGVCVSLVGESAVQLCDRCFLDPLHPSNRGTSIGATSFGGSAFLSACRQTSVIA